MRSLKRENLHDDCGVPRFVISGGYKDTVKPQYAPVHFARSNYIHYLFRYATTAGGQLPQIFVLKNLTMPLPGASEAEWGLHDRSFMVHGAPLCADIQLM